MHPRKVLNPKESLIALGSSRHARKKCSRLCSHLVWVLATRIVRSYIREDTQTNKCSNFHPGCGDRGLVVHARNFRISCGLLSPYLQVSCEQASNFFHQSVFNCSLSLANPVDPWWWTLGCNKAILRDKAIVAIRIAYRRCTSTTYVNSDSRMTARPITCLPALQHLRHI